ncbi:MAG TPA: HhH-GPD-type base excision DNA repair protein [Pseudonocardiaceae bacterium]|nr:HhH-GPD-type base excision DNA repair protein [Pseudonocardiaceae bacterium]
MLDRDPLALLLGMLLDQQVPIERAFAAPYQLQQRLGHDLDVYELATYDPDALAELFAAQPALHRYPKAMAVRVQDICRALVEHYDGDVTGLWRDVPHARDLLDRLVALPGYGMQKAQIFVALLGKQRNVRPEGWREVAGPYGDEGVFRSVADVTDAESLAKVREYKQQVKAAFRAKK